MCAMIRGPADGPRESVGGRAQLEIEYSYSQQLGVRSLLVNGRGDCGAVTEPIAIFRRILSVRDEGNTARHGSNVWVSSRNTAVDDCDAHAASGLPRERRAAQR